MNTIREIQSINKRELETLTPAEGSWHRDFADTAFIYIGGLPFDLSEGDILTIFSQYGEPTYINLIREKESGKSKGFCFLKYEDQRSTDLAVDNLGGANVMGRVLKVDHTRYKRKDGEEEEEAARQLREVVEDVGVSDEVVEEKRRPLTKEEIELLKLERDHNDDDPMKDYLVQEKKEEVSRALARLKKDGGRDRDKTRSRRHHHHRSHRDKDERWERRRSDVSDDRDGRQHRHSHHYRRRSGSP